ncbi:hypothetical protein P3S68_023850 [Capsicum galapagoense]
MILFLFFLFFPIILIFLIPKAKKSGKDNLPPGPIGLPFIGNLHQYDSVTPHIYFWKLSKKYGKIFSLKFGSTPMVVVSSAKLAKERISVFHLFSHKKVKLFSPIREDEVSRMIKKISQQATTSEITNLSNLIIKLQLFNCRVVFGIRFDEEAHAKRRFDELLEESATMLTSFFVSDFFPYLAWIDKLTGLTDRLEKNFKNLDEFYEELIEQHLDPNKPKSIEGDLLDILLQLKKEKSTSIDLTLEDIKAILMNVLLAGSDTSAAAIIWAITTLIKNPKVMKKVQEEIRRSVGKKDGILNEDDIQNLPYFKADMTGTIIHVNAWAIARDPEIWENPEKFIPERFLNNNIDFKGQDLVFIPFGAGQRGCPGIALGVASMELASSNLLYAFDWELPREMKKEDINTDAKRGLTTHKKNDLCLRIIYRFM